MLNKSYIKYLIYAVALAVSFLLGYQCYSYTHPLNSATTNSSSDSATVITEDTTVTVAPKTDENDLVVEHKYIAKVNGETLEVPKTNIEKTTTTVSSTIDLTPVAHQIAEKEYKRNWELSVGLGKTHNGDFYVPIGIQRNFNYNRAVEVSIGVTHDHIENIQVSHKWKF